MAQKGVGFDGKLIGIGLVAVILAAVGTSLLTYYLFGKGGESQATVAQPRDLVSMPVGDFTVNLADKGGLHFLRASISVGTSGSQLEKLRTRESQIRDLIIQVLRSKTKAELENAQGLEALRKELVRKLSGDLGQGKVFTVYFTDFVVQ